MDIHNKDHIMEYHSAISKYKILKQFVKRLDLRNAMLNESSQKQTNNIWYNFIFTKCPEKIKL
jgi:hypothetical protein